RIGTAKPLYVDRRLIRLTACRRDHAAPRAPARGALPAAEESTRRTHSEQRTAALPDVMLTYVPLIDIRRVDGRADFRRFIDYAYDRNAADPHWIPPLRLSEHERLTPKKNPFFEHADVELLLAWRGGRVAGRIAAIDDRLHREAHRDRTGMFGFFEAQD